MAKYDPLRRFLKRSARSEVKMTFADVERVIGGMLPKSAQRPQWWANETDPLSRHVQSKAWLEAGFEAFLLPGADQVIFRRQAR